MINIIRSTRVYKDGALQEVDKFEAESMQSLESKQSDLLRHGFVPMDPTLFTKIIDVDLHERHVITVKLQKSTRFEGRANAESKKLNKGMRI
jgi:hypothetical protein